MAEALPHVALPPPSPARSIPRRLFDPVMGSVRRLERETSILVSREVYPRIPGLSRIYDRILARRLTLVEGAVPLPGLPPGLEGTTVLLITDLHTGPFVSVEALREALARLASTAPDLVILGGDFVTTKLAELAPHEPALRALEAPLGTFAVLGNHDHYCKEPDGLRELLTSFGIQVLHNDGVRIGRGGGKLALCGIDDWNAGRPDLDRALSAVAPLRDPVILVSHNPDAFFAATARGASLVLSGHTHGGQIRVPGLPVLVRMSRYRLDEGRYASGSAQIVVSRGIGVTGLPLRIACPPEAVLLHLRRA